MGASGDLAPLSHLALGMMGEGQMWSPETGWDNAKQVCLNRKVYSLHEGTIVNETHQFKKTYFVLHKSHWQNLYWYFIGNNWLPFFLQVLEAHGLEPIKLEAKEVCWGLFQVTYC